MSDRRKYLLLIGVIVAALVGALLLAVPGSPVYQKPTLGLDLQGGLEVALKATPPKGHKLTPEDMNRSLGVMQERVNKLGVTEADVRKQGSDQIVIQLAGVHDPEAAAKLIGTTAQLMLFDFENDLTGPSVDSNGNPIAAPALYPMLKEVQAQAKKGSPEAYYLFRNKQVAQHTTKKTTKTVNGKKVTVTTPVTKQVTKRTLLGTAATLKELYRPYGGKQPESTELLKVPPHTIVISCPTANGCLGARAASAGGTYYYLMKYFPSREGKQVPEMTGSDLVLSGTRADFGQTGGPIVTLQFTNHGSDQFHKITREEAQRGQTRYDLAGRQGDAVNYAQHFAIVLDQQLRSTPYIDFQRNPDGIPGPNAEIDLGNGGTFQEAKDLALILQTGALPVSFQQLERTDVSATLGKESLTQAWHAALVGLLIVAVFLIILYRFLGLVAVFGLAIYSLLYYAAILLFNVTLTLPGFAGLILTIGVAADANVVVFERIKEEVRAGKSVRAAVSAGYGKGFHTILDANVVTAITALVLFLIAVASVKGFALMLLIGTLISLLTAVAATRALLGLLAGFKWFSNPRVMGVRGEQIPRWAKIDVASPRRRSILLGVATAAIVGSILAIAVKGLNFGIDFKGGTQMSFITAKPRPTTAVENVFKADGLNGALVQGRGSNVGNAYTHFQVRTKHLTNAQQARLLDDLRAGVGLKGQANVNTVSSSFSSQIARDAIIAIIVSFLLISVYISLRFQWRFAVPILRSLFNDILITMGVYALSGREVSISTVAAVLTVLGYSIYDTIIVFDRVRENMPLMPKATFAAIANLSIAETLRRSAATTFITLVPVVSLYVLGGQTLQDFAFALLIGIGLGAFSTIFVATPFLTVLMERSPDFKRRTGSAVVDETTARRTMRRAARGMAVPEAAVDGGEPAPEPAAVTTPATAESSSAEAARREKRRQRRTRPHGRAR